MWCNVGFAEEMVLYCIDQDSKGFNTKSEPYESANYHPGRFTAKVDFENYRLNIDGNNYTLVDEVHKMLHFYTNGFSYSIRFYDRKNFKYYRSNMFGMGDSISISYGKCSKF